MSFDERVGTALCQLGRAEAAVTVRRHIHELLTVAKGSRVDSMQWQNRRTANDHSHSEI